MADSVGRIIPPSVSVDRAAAIARERGSRNRDKARKQEAPAALESAQDSGLGEIPEETNKGKILDINV